MDDLYIWTASGSSSFKRWTVPPRRSLRAARESGMDVLSSPSLDHQLRHQSRTDSPDFASQNTNSGLPFGLSSSPVLSRALGSSEANRRRDSGISFSEPMQRSDSPSPAGPSPRAWTHQPKLSTHSSASVTGTVHSINTIGPGGVGGAKATQEGMFGIPYASLIKLVGPNDPYNIGGAGRPPSMLVGSPYRPSQSGMGIGGAPSSSTDHEMSTLYSSASMGSIPLGSSDTNGPHPPSLWNNSTTSPPASLSSPRFPYGASHPPQTVNQQPSARDLYEDRELAVSATPLHTRPNDIIRGTSGLVKSIILNDRVHALTVDNDGEVACWDLVRGLCVGVWSVEEVGNEYAASFSSSEAGNGGGGGSWVKGNPREALETVRERIEGEAMTPSWSTIDTKIGHLTVHIMESRGFDAEIYVDEMDFLHDAQQLADNKFPEDHKLNVGKWVLANLFSAFVEAELQLAAEYNAPALPPLPAMDLSPVTINNQHLQVPSDTSTSSAVTAASRPIIAHSQSSSITRGSAPTHISLDLPPLSATQPGKRLRSVSDLTNAITTKTPGLGHGTPAMTPAVLDDLPPPSPVVGIFGGAKGLVKKLSGKNLNASSGIANASNGTGIGQNLTGGLSTIPGTPGTATNTPGLNPTAGTAPIATPGATSTSGTAPSKTPAAATGSGAHDYFTAVVRGRGRSGSLQAPGEVADGASDGGGAGGGLMGRLRNFGKTSKRPNSGDPTAAPIPENEDIASNLDAAKEGNDQEQEGGDSLTRPAIFVKDLAPIPILDAPLVPLPSNMALMISEETETGGTNWDLLYHGLVGTIEEDIKEIETAAPTWLIELLLRGGALAQANNASGAGGLGLAPTLKISFVVIAWHKRSEPVSELSSYSLDCFSFC
ncbi:hypothetical protein FRC03_003442 [Tulasnella sp. 419]|nr:hypothetical protein FRC03_003442 [Tulasnella sp. 419]